MSDDNVVDEMPKLEGFTDEEWEVYKAVIKAIYRIDAPADVTLTPLLDILVMTAHAANVKKPTFLSAVEAMWNDVNSELNAHQLDALKKALNATSINKTTKNFNVN